MNNAQDSKTEMAEQNVYVMLRKLKAQRINAKCLAQVLKNSSIHPTQISRQFMHSNDAWVQGAAGAEGIAVWSAFLLV